MNLEEILAECQKGRNMVGDAGGAWTWDEIRMQTTSYLVNNGPWSLAPIKREITLEQLERAWVIADWDKFKKELGF